MTDLRGKKVVVRGIESGVFFGTLVDVDEKVVELADCRNIWRWTGATNLHQVAVDGVDINDDYTRISVKVDSIILNDVCEIILLSEKAIKILEAAKPWKI